MNETIIEEDIKWEFGISIDNLIKDLKRLKKKGATNINIIPGESYGIGSVYIEAVTK